MIPVQIRATHPYGFRSGEWARVIGLVWSHGRPCWHVMFPDGRTDTWVKDDPSDPYEFRADAVTLAMLAADSE